MTTLAVVDLALRVGEKVVDTIRKKNTDYAGKDTPNAFANFEISEYVLGISKEKALLVRTLDKIKRVAVLLDQSNSVEGEGLTDSIEDVIGYMHLLNAMVVDKRKLPPLPPAQVKGDNG